MLGEQRIATMTRHPNPSLPNPSLRRLIQAEPFAVRQALQDLLNHFPLNALDPDQRGTVEVVLAEVFNNIVEHAYADDPGEIEVEITQIGQHLHCMLRDRGRPMPEAKLPTGALPQFTDGLDAPEGGFGWYLIRAMASDLKYQRDAEQNLLTFQLEIDASSH